MFSRMRSKGSRFTLGVWGLRVCSQPSAAVLNRPHEVAMAVPMASSAKGVTSGGPKCRLASFCVAGVARCDIPTCLITCRKSFWAAGAILSHRFQKMSCIFRGTGSTLETSIVSLVAGAALQTCRVACFCESNCQGGVKWRQHANSAAGVVFCEMWSLARNI